MRAIDHREDHTSGAKPSGALRLVEVPRPDLGREDVLIRVACAGVNRPDILQRRGLYDPPKDASPYLGLEVSGYIEMACEGAPWEVGQAVCALTHGGGYADYVAVNAGHVLPVPSGLSLVEAAALPETVLTVYANLVEHGGLKCFPKSDERFLETEARQHNSHETVMVHGANSGIGAMTIVMGKALGAKVIATARGASKCDFARTLGADLVIDTEAEDFVAAVKAFGGADIILDIIGGDFAAKNIDCLNFKGRLVQVGFGKSPVVELNLIAVMAKQAVITGSMLRPRSVAEKARLISVARDHIWPMIEAGTIRPVVDRVFDLTEAEAGHDWLISGQQKGKVVLRVNA